jgi:acetyl esterase
MDVDPAFAALLADPRNRIRRPPASIPMAAIRAVARTAMAQQVGPPVASVETLSAPAATGAVSIRLYRPSREAPLPLLLFIHGGGFVYCDLDTHDGLCRELVHASGCAVASVDYRLAPEDPFPAGLEDCDAALRWLIGSAERLGLDGARFALCGDSAGGNLALAVAMAARDTGLIAGAIGLFYPLLDPSCGSASLPECADDYLLTVDGIRWFWDLYLGAERDRTDPQVALLEADLRGLPPTLIVTAEFDPLRDEGEELAARLESAGVPVQLRRYAGMIHGFATMTDLTPVGRDAISLAGSFLGAALRP